MKSSVWTLDVKKTAFPKLNKDEKTKVLIVGGGMAGLLCAHALKEAGVDCIVAEAKQICGGTTQNTTAKITLQHGLLYDSLISRFGKEKALLYYKAEQEALDKYARLCEGLDCDYERKNAFVYSLTDEAKIKKEHGALKLLGADTAFYKKTPLPLSIAGAVCVKNQAQFHPLKFAYGIAAGLPIYENTKVLELMPHKAITAGGEISFDKIIIATHFPLINKHGGYFLKLYQHRSYVLALEGAQNVEGMYVDESHTGFSFRNYKGLLLLGGGGHRTGKRGGAWQELKRFAKKHYPGCRVVGQWAAQDCMSLDGVPYIGRYSKSTPDMFVATGFNKWGMSSSMVAATVLADLVQGKENVYASVFSPSRSVWAPQLAANAFESTIGLLTPTVPRCPHLGCALRYNRQEHSWDCPCHGSRFDENGALLNNPATDDKRLN